MFGPLLQRRRPVRGWWMERKGVRLPERSCITMFIHWEARLTIRVGGAEGGSGGKPRRRPNASRVKASFALGTESKQINARLFRTDFGIWLCSPERKPIHEMNWLDCFSGRRISPRSGRGEIAPGIPIAFSVQRVTAAKRSANILLELLSVRL